MPTFGSRAAPINPYIETWPTGPVTIPYGTALGSVRLTGASVRETSLYGPSLVGGTFQIISATLDGTTDVVSIASNTLPLGIYRCTINYMPPNTTDYYFNSMATITLAITIIQAPLTVSSWPSGSTGIAYGTALNAVTLTGGVGSPGGEFKITGARKVGDTVDSDVISTSSVPGDYDCTISYVALDPTLYSPAATTITRRITITKATLSVSSWPSGPLNVSYGTALNAVTLTGVGSPGGQFRITAASVAITSTTLALGDYDCTISYVPLNPALYNAAATTGTITIRIETATLTVTTPPSGPNNIVYGTALDTVTLTGGIGSPGGKFEITSAIQVGDTVVSDVTSTSLALETYDCTISYSPLNPALYNAAVTTSRIRITITKATLTVSSWPSGPLNVAYGTAFNTLPLTGGVGSPGGEFQLTGASVDIASTTLARGAYDCTISYVPLNPALYNAAVTTGTIRINVIKTTLFVLSWPSGPLNVVYGTTLNTVNLTGGSGSSGGKFQITRAIRTGGANVANIIADAGIYTCTISYVTLDPLLYDDATTTSPLTITIDKATPVINSWPTVLTTTIRYGNVLSTVLSTDGSASISGAFRITSATPGSFDPTSTTLAAGSYTCTISFVPDNSTNYESVSRGTTITITITTTKIVPTVTTLPTPSTSISVGTALSAISLTGGSVSVPGSWAWVDSTITPPGGTSSQQIRFTPTDTSTYENVTTSIIVTVTKITPTITWPTGPTSIDGGIALNTVSLTGGNAEAGGASVPGAFRITSTTTGADVTSTNLAVATYDCIISFIPTDTTTYETVVASTRLSITINTITPTVTWPTTATITYGKKLRSTIFTSGSATDGGTSITGGVFTVVSGTASIDAVLPPGNYDCGIAYTPPSTRYASVTATDSISITIARYKPVILTRSAWNNNTDGCQSYAREALDLASIRVNNGQYIGSNETLFGLAYNTNFSPPLLIDMIRTITNWKKNGSPFTPANYSMDNSSTNRYTTYTTTDTYTCTMNFVAKTGINSADPNYDIPDPVDITITVLP